MPRKRTSTPENYNAPLPMRLRELMSSSGHTQANLAAHLGITRQSVSAYMDGSANPTPTAITSIAKFLGVSTDYLLGVSDYRKTETTQLTAEELGLSEDAASALQFENGRYNKSKLVVLNYLIENMSFLEKITSYLSISFINLARKRPFLLIPFDKRNADARLFFADIIESLPKLKSSFFESVKTDAHAAEQMVFTLISECLNGNEADGWFSLLYKNRDDPDAKDNQLSMIAKFLRFYDYADLAIRLDCDLEQFIMPEDDDNKEGEQYGILQNND